jgi:predicted Ser/Thr protein kinase
MKNTFFLKILCVDFQVDPASITKGDVIGKGQFEKVYRGAWRGTPVAVKVIDLLPEMKKSNWEDIKELKICRCILYLTEKTTTSSSRIYMT